MRLAPPPHSCKVPTPEDLALAMVTCLGDEPDAKWLEPSHGTGIFVEAIAGLGVTRNRVVAVDLDREPSKADKLATTFRRTDFLRWARKSTHQFDRIIGNPPYVSIKQLPASLQNAAAATLDLDERPIGRASNLWYAFVLASLRLLKKGGSIAFVLPSSAEFASYSKSIRETIREHFASVEIHRSRTSLFDGVQDGTVVAIAKGFKEPVKIVRRFEYDDRSSLIEGILRERKDKGRRCALPMKPKASAKIRFNSIATVRLGGVTGDARYFLLNEARRLALGLPEDALTPVLSKAKHLQSASSTRAYWESLRDANERVWLFNPTDESLADECVQRYLNEGVSAKACNQKAYKIRMRDPWYRTPLPVRVDAFLSGMGKDGPWLSINEMPELSASNTLYVVTFHKLERKDWYMFSLSLLTSDARKQIQRIQRRYSDGLLKIEPGSLVNIELPPMRIDLNYPELYNSAIDLLTSGRMSEAMRIANEAKQ